MTSPVFTKGNTTYIRTNSIRYPVHIRYKKKGRWIILKEKEYNSLIEAIKKAKKYNRVTITDSSGVVYYARSKLKVIMSLPK